MRKVLICFFLVLVIVLGGCSSGGGEAKEEDTSGYGLEVSFSVDSDTYIKRRQVFYTLNLKNSGLEPVNLNSENFKLITKQVISGDGGVQDVFTDDSMNAFYEKVLGDGGELELVNNQEKKVTGILEIEESFFNNLNNEELEYQLDVNFDYKTKFTNNIELKFENGLYSLKVLDKVSQAAPLQITNIKMVSELEKEMYVIEYSVADKGKGGSNSPATRIDNMDVTFRDDYLSSCQGTYENERNLELSEIVIKKGSNLIMECPIRIPDGGSFNTKTFGYLYYNYKMKFDGKIELPRD